MNEIQKTVSLKTFRATILIMIVLAGLLAVVTFNVGRAGYVGDETEQWYTPSQEASYIVGQYNSSHYYMQNHTGHGYTAFMGYDDLSTNASAVINNAIGNSTSGENIFVKTGTYNLNGSIIGYYKDNITLAFENGATLFVANGMNRAAIYISGCNNWLISGVTINGNAVNQAISGPMLQDPDGILIAGSCNVKVENALIDNCRVFGVNIIAPSETAVHSGVINSKITNCGWNGITLGGSNIANELSLYAINNEVVACSDVGITTYGIGDIVTDNYVHDINGTTGYNNVNVGIMIEGGCNAVVSQNIIEDCLCGISISEALYSGIDNCTISKNVITNSATYTPAAGALGIGIVSKYNSITDNYIGGIYCNSSAYVGGEGIYVVGGTFNSISRNDLSKCGNIGIYLDDTSNNNTLTLNTVSDTAVGNFWRTSHAGTGINVVGSSNYISQNQVFDDRSAGARTQAYGIYLETGALYNTVILNNLYNHVTANLTNSGTGTIIRYNFGFVSPSDQIGSASFIISVSGTTYSAVNCTDGSVLYSSTNVTKVEQFALGNMTSGLLYLIEVEHNASLSVGATQSVMTQYQGSMTFTNVTGSYQFGVGGATGPAGPVGTANGLPFTYMVFTNATSNYMLNGTTGAIDYQNTNSTTVLRYALGNMTSGGLFHIRPGSYAAFGLNPLSNTIVEGEGRATKLIFPNGLYDDQGHLGYEENNVFYVETQQNVIIRNMEIDGNQSAYAKYEVAPAHNGNGIRFNNSVNCEAYGLYIHDTRRSGILVRGNTYTFKPVYITVHDSYFANCNWDGIEFADCSDATAYNCFITGTSDVSFATWEGKRITFDNMVCWSGNRDMGSTDGHNCFSYDGGSESYCTSEMTVSNSKFWNFTGEGVLFLNGAHNCKLIHNTFEDIGLSGVWSNAQNAYDNTIEDNSFQNCANGSMLGVINIIGSGAVSKGWIIEGNTIDSTDNTGGNDVGIVLVNSQYDQIKNNHISNLGGKGINLAQCNNTQIIGNNLYNISWNIFKFEGTSNFNITIKDNQCYTTAGYMFKLEDIPMTGFNIENNWFDYPSGQFKDGNMPNSTILAYNRGYRTEYSSSATNATATTFTFTPSMAETPIRVYASFNSTEITAWAWSYTGGTLTITVVNSATTEAARTCYVEAYSWNYP